MNAAQSHVGKSHTGDILRQRHVFTRNHVISVGGGRAQIFRYYFDSLYGKHIGQLPRALCDISLYGMGKRVHTRCRSKPFRHGGHKFGVHNRHYGNVVRVDANHFAAALLVRNDVIYGDFGGCAGGRRQRNYRHALVFRIGGAFQRDYVCEFGICGDNGNGLGCVYRRAPSHRNDKIRAGFFICGNAVLYVGYRRICLKVRKYLVRYIFQLVRNHFYRAEFNQILIGDDKRLFVAALFDFRIKFLPRSTTEICGFV